MIFAQSNPPHRKPDGELLDHARADAAPPRALPKDDRRDDNPYRAPQVRSQRRPMRPTYDPLELTRKLLRVFWFVAIIATIIAVGSVLFR